MNRFVLVITILLCAATARAADADLEEAKRIAAQSPEGTRVLFVPPVGEPRCIARCDQLKGPFWLVGRDSARLGTIGGKTKRPEGIGAGLFVMTFSAMAPAAPVAPAKPAAQPPAEQPKADEKKADEKKAAETPEAARSRMVKEYFEKTSVKLNRAESGGIASETLQILGQIVADRASGAAVELLTNRLLTELHCVDDEGKPRKTDFPRTCVALQSVRLQDLAGASDSLRAALVADGLAYVRAHAPKYVGMQPAALDPGAAALASLGDSQREAVRIGLDLLTTALPEILRTQRGMDAPVASAAARRLMDQGLLYLRDGVKASRVYREELEKLTRGQKTVLTAALGFSQCVVANQMNECPTGEFVRKAAEALSVSDDAELLVRAEALLIHVLAALTARADEKPLWRQRVSHAVDATFDATCLLIDTSTSTAEPLQSCPAEAPTSKPTDAFGWLSAGHYLLIAAIDGDVSGILSGIGVFFDGDERKGLRLLGGVIRYAETYTGPDAKSADAHERRVKLLEDLTSEMTDRSARDGDVVWSLGGALMAVVGGRIPLEKHEKAAVYGPIGLPIGIGVQKVGGGIHAAVGIVDLGQYVAWEPGLEVAEPDLEDALAPSLTLGYA
ncbi:MAG TPA: hypothetical protein VF103_03785, partial [Polyangiaceae bacterium]